MTAKEFYQAGRLAEAIDRLGEDIKKSPGESDARIFLFELLCFSGDLVRAQKHLDAVSVTEMEANMAVAGYRSLLSAETVRRDVLSGRLQPQIPAPVPSYAAKHIDALKFISAGDGEAAASLIEEAVISIPSCRVRINGQPADDFGDSDDILRPFLEAMIEGVYCWIPWQSIRSLSLTQPKNLRDLYWIPASLELDSGESKEMFLPVLYGKSYLSPNDRIRLGRETEWQTDIPGLSLGIGQRVFAAGEADFGILEVKQLEIDHAESINPS